MSKSIRVNTNSLNRYGFRVISEGIDLKYFLLNPIMFYNHHRTWRGEKSEMLPIGKWENLRVENGVLLADPVFDEDDDFALKIKKKFDKGMLNAASVNVYPIETSEDEKDLVKGQSRPTVTKSELREISIVDIPGNREAVVLSDEAGNTIELSDKGNTILPLIKRDMEKIFKAIAIKLGLSESATEGEILNAIAGIQSDNVSLKTKNDAYVKAEEDMLKEKAVKLVDKAIADKKIKKTDREIYLEMAESGYDKAVVLFDGMSALPNLKDVPGAEKPELTFVELSKKNNGKDLLKLREEDPEAYKQLFFDEYGKYPKNVG